MASFPTAPGPQRNRCRILLCLFGIFALYLIAVLFRMQIFDYEDYQEKVLRQITVGSSLQAARGEIYDRNGNLLAGNRTVWRIYISPVDIGKAIKKKGKPFDRIIADGLADILSVDAQTVYRKAQNSAYLDQTVLRNVDAETADKVLAFAEENGLSSMIHAEPGTRRTYPYASLAAQTIGFTGSDNQGLFGLEAYYNAVLSGEDGKYITAVDSRGIRLPPEYSDYKEGTAGASIVTTLDCYIQTALEHYLEAAMIASDAQNRVTGIAMDPSTGGIYAMATLPAFDLNDPYTLAPFFQEKLDVSGLAPGSEEYAAQKNQLLYTMWNNKAVSEIYEPGSTFKIVTVSTALQTGAVKVTDRFTCPGYYVVGGCRISCHKRGGHGTVTFAEGLQQSCNPAMMQAAERIGAQNFYEYYLRFGYGGKTGIDLPGEALGIFHSPSSLGSTELATASFGQRFKVSVIQQLCAVAAVANDGVPVTPHLLDQITDSDGNTLYRYEAQEKERILSVETAQTVAQILEEGVSGNGGAKNAYAEGYEVAAKTGTSEKFDILDAAGRSYLRIGSCVAFAPYKNAKIAVILIVDEPTGPVKYGSTTAAPYVSGFLSTVLPYLGVAPQYGEEENVAVDNYVGKSVKEIKATLSNEKIGYRIIGDGDTVIAQVPAAGLSVRRSTARILLYTKEEKKEETAVPDLRGKSVADATQAVIGAGLNIRFRGATQKSDAIGTAVTAQSLPPGSKVPIGTVIELTVFYPGEPD